MMFSTLTDGFFDGFMGGCGIPGLKWNKMRRFMEEYVYCSQNSNYYIRGTARVSKDLFIWCKCWYVVEGLFRVNAFTEETRGRNGECT